MTTPSDEEVVAAARALLVAFALSEDEEGALTFRPLLDPNSLEAAAIARFDLMRIARVALLAAAEVRKEQSSTGVRYKQPIEATIRSRGEQDD